MSGPPELTGYWDVDEDGDPTWTVDFISNWITEHGLAQSWETTGDEVRPAIDALAQCIRDADELRVLDAMPLANMTKQQLMRRVKQTRRDKRRSDENTIAVAADRDRLASELAGVRASLEERAAAADDAQATADMHANTIRQLRAKLSIKGESAEITRLTARNEALEAALLEAVGAFEDGTEAAELAAAGRLRSLIDWRTLVVDTVAPTTADIENPQVTPVDDEPTGKPLWRGWEEP